MGAVIGLTIVNGEGNNSGLSYIHGPKFNTPFANHETGIKVGTYNVDALPDITRKFTAKSRDSIIIPYDRLSRGITILGDMGCGKSRLMYALHDGIRENYPNIPMLIHDPKGEWLRTYYNPDTDLIFAPYDSRSASWSLWKDFEEHPELIHPMVSTAIQAHHSNNADKFWASGATTLLKDILSEPTIEQSREILLAKRDISSNDRTFQGIYASAMGGLRDMAGIELSARNKGGKSIDEFMSLPGRIFLLNNPTSSAEQYGALSIFLSAFLLQSLSRPDVKEGELQAAVFIDEALTFHLPAEVEKAVFTQSRSKGLCVISSAQRLPKINHGERGDWGDAAAHICAMRVSDLDTRDKLSKRLGEIKYEEEQTSTTTGKSDQPGQFFSSKSTSSTTSYVLRQHLALRPEDFGRLKNREFILFHEHGTAPGAVIEVKKEQNPDIKIFSYDRRKDVIDFMSKL